ncbi:hypothetical protein [Prevotella sp.]|mgnify:CR=1 FL=1|uniref:hypothetical protein n=1 Tax=Prevotella sp. TaxID=59823 RepID=UPI002600F101|nr:hypothetical protein [Prevotella sp.]
MTKKILSTLALSLAMLTASAQSQPNRLIVHQKSGGFTSYRLGSVDSLSFYNVEGEVRADVKINDYKTGDTGDTLWVAVTKTPACSSYRIDVLPSVRVNAYSDDVIANYFNQQKGATAFYDDFTNAQLTGFSTKFEPDTKYTVFTLGYDQLGTPCEVSRAEIETPVGDIVGNPQVACTVTKADYQALTFSFKPNEDVSSYYITIFPEGEAEAQFNQWGPMFGFANMSAMIKQFGRDAYEGEMEHTINSLNPGTDYELYILPLDAEGNNGKLQITKCKTKAMGGEGKSVMTITVKDDFTDQGNGVYTQTVVYTPNDQTNLHRDMVVDKVMFEDKNGSWKGDESKIVEYLQTPNTMDPNWDQYGEDVATWGVEANTAYIAYSIGQNAKGEWGELAKKEFTTPAAASAPAYAPATSTVMKRVAPAQAKKPGMAPAKTFIQLQEK